MPDREWLMKHAQEAVGSIHMSLGICAEATLCGDSLEHFRISRAAGEDQAYYRIIETDTPEESLVPPVYSYPRTDDEWLIPRGGWVGESEKGWLRKVLNGMVEPGEILLQGGGRWADDDDEDGHPEKRLCVPPLIAASEGWEEWSGWGDVARAGERRSTVGFDGGEEDAEMGVGITRWASWMRDLQASEEPGWEGSKRRLYSWMLEVIISPIIFHFMIFPLSPCCILPWGLLHINHV